MIAHYIDLCRHLSQRLAPALLPLAARLVFAGVLLFYFWGAAWTKLGAGLGGLFSPSVGAYAQILPKAFEAVGYDASALPWWAYFVVLFGMWAEFVLPALITLGLAARPAALAMIGFVIVQSLVDIYGHGIAGGDIGAWFDGQSGALIADQRAYWVLGLLIIVLQGAGPLSADRLLARRFAATR